MAVTKKRPTIEGIISDPRWKEANQHKVVERFISNFVAPDPRFQNQELKEKALNTTYKKFGINRPFYGDGVDWETGSTEYHKHLGEMFEKSHEETLNKLDETFVVSDKQKKGGVPGAKVLKEINRVSDTPFLDYNKLGYDYDPDLLSDSALVQTIFGAYKGGVKLTTGMLTPKNLAIIVGASALPGYGPALLSGYFGSMLLAHLPDYYKKLEEHYNKGELGKYTETAVELFGTMGLSIGAFKNSFLEGRNVYREKTGDKFKVEEIKKREPTKGEEGIYEDINKIPSYEERAKGFVISEEISRNLDKNLAPPTLDTRKPRELPIDEGALATMRNKMREKAGAVEQVKTVKEVPLKEGMVELEPESATPKIFRYRDRQEIKFKKQKIKLERTFGEKAGPAKPGDRAGKMRLSANPIPDAIGIIAKMAWESKTANEFAQKVNESSELRALFRGQNLSSLYEEVRGKPAEFKITEPTPGVFLPPHKKLEKEIKISNEHLEKSLEQMENIEKTGTYQPKEGRSFFTKADLEAKDFGMMVSPKKVERLKTEYLNAGREYNRQRKLAEEYADPSTIERLSDAEKRAKNALAEMESAMTVSGRTLQAWNKALKELKEIVGYARKIEDVQPKIALLDRVAISLALKMNKTELATKIAMGEELLPKTKQIANAVATSVLQMFGSKKKTDFDALKFRTGLEKFPDKLRPGRAIFDLAKYNLFPVVSFSRDAYTNAVAIGYKAPSYMLRDAYDMATGQSPSMVAGVMHALKTMTKASKERWINKNPQSLGLPESVEMGLGVGVREVGGGEVTGTSARLFGFPLDWFALPAVKLKRYADVVPSRMFALAELYSHGIREAGKLGLRGEDRQKFIDDFVKNPSDKAVKESIETGKEVKFNVQGSFIEDLLTAGDVGRMVSLTAEAFPRWQFQYTRWVARSLGLNPRFFKKVKDGEATKADIIQYLTESATGWGGIMLFNEVFYDNIDANTMEFVNEKNERTRFSGLSPMPELFTLSAIYRGDFDKAMLSLRHTSFPFAKTFSEFGGGLMVPITRATAMYAKQMITHDQYIQEMSNVVNSYIPGKGVLGIAKVLLDPVLRHGVGRSLPIVSKFKRPVIDITTGEPLESKQEAMGVRFTSPDSTVPGAKRVQTWLARELGVHGLHTTFSRRTPILEISSDEVPEMLKERFERQAGKLLNVMAEGGEATIYSLDKNFNATEQKRTFPGLKNDPRYQMLWDIQRGNIPANTVPMWKSARSYADIHIDKNGKHIREEDRDKFADELVRKVAFSVKFKVLQKMLEKAKKHSLAQIRSDLGFLVKDKAFPASVVGLPESVGVKFNKLEPMIVEMEEYIRNRGIE